MLDLHLKHFVFCLCLDKICFCYYFSIFSFCGLSYDLFSSSWMRLWLFNLVCPQNVDVVRPLQPQGHELLQTSETPTFPAPPDNPGNDAQPATADPPSPTVAQPLALDPTAAPQIPSDASTAVKPSVPLTSSSSESEETLPNLQNPANPRPLDSSSEETGGPVALRPPFNFRYQRRDRKKRQALMETPPSHQPVFLSEFPSGTSPFRSCPGPSRYATV